MRQLQTTRGSRHHREATLCLLEEETTFPVPPLHHKSDSRECWLPNRRRDVGHAAKWAIGSATGCAQRERAKERASKEPKERTSLVERRKSKTAKAAPDPGGKPRVVYFSLREDHQEDGFAGMVMRREPEDQEPSGDETQRALEREVPRMMTLPASEIERQFRQELQFVPPTSKATMPSPPDAMVNPAAGGVLSAVPMGSDGTHMSMVAGEPSPQRAAFLEECPHSETTRRGTNAHVEMVRCKQCGKVLKKVSKNPTQCDKPMQECHHENVSWRGTNGHVWHWSCPDCGTDETIKKVPGAQRPVPGRPYDVVPMAEPRSASSAAGSVPGLPIGGTLTQEIQFGSSADWSRYRDLLDNMVRNHLEARGEITTGEFYQLVQATSLCFKGLHPGWNARSSEEQQPLDARRALFETPTSRTTRSSPGTPAGGEGATRMTFGKYKGMQFQEVYEIHPVYVDWTLREAQRGETYLSYCMGRSEAETDAGHPGVAYMVNQGQHEEEDAEDLDQIEKTCIFLDSGCTQTCHGEVWMQRLDSEVKSLSGIGGKTMTLGEGLLYVIFESGNGTRIPGEIQSTELDLQHHCSCLCQVKKLWAW